MRNTVPLNYALLLLLLCLLTTQQAFYCANAFVSPSRSCAFHSRIRIESGAVCDLQKSVSSKMTMMIPNEDLISTQFSSSIVLLSVDQTAEAMASLQGIRTFFGVSSALVFAAISLYFVTGAIIVPKATQQLEKDTKRLRPGLWEEYVEKANLKKGETMTDRPELLQELGNTMQPIIMADFEKSAAESKNK